MATISYTVSRDPGANGIIVTWDGLGNADSGAAFPVEGRVEATVMHKGTMGGATLKWEGSLDGGTTWATLDDTFGVALSFTAAPALKPVGPVVPLIRPSTSGGTTASLTALLYLRFK